MILYALLVSLGFGGLYVETALAHASTPSGALVVGAAAFVALLIAFLAPPGFFRYTTADLAPVVQTQVISRAIVASVIVIALNVGVWLVVAPNDMSLVEELYVYSLATILVFHGLGGVIASHVVYLQVTKQYNSNQLVAVLVLVTLLLLILTLYFIAFDWALPRDAYVHLRDLTLITLVLVAYGRAIYLMAHH